jgi:hypothetical protein
LTIQQYILLAVREENPKTVEHLVKLIQLKYSIPQKTVMENILLLQSQGKLVFKKTSQLVYATLKDYVLSSKALWYWIVITFAFATTLSVFTIPESSYPLIYARYLCGSLFIFLLPGYSLIKVLFPTQELSNIERTALSLGLSLAIVPITGLVLNYTPWGISVIPITLSLLILTTLFATAAIVREYKRLG